MLILYQSSSVIEDAKAANYAEFSCKFVRVLVGLDIPAVFFLYCVSLGMSLLTIFSHFLSFILICSHRYHTYLPTEIHEEKAILLLIFKILKFSWLLVAIKTLFVFLHTVSKLIT